MRLNKLFLTILIPLLMLGGLTATVNASTEAGNGDRSTAFTALHGLGSSTSVVLAIDTSDSMYGVPLESAKEAAQFFIQNLGESTPVAVVTFSSRAKLVHGFSTDHAMLQDAIGELYTSGVTALYDGSLLAVETASQANTPQRVVVLLSDGAEYGGQSSALREEARERAAAEDIMIYTIGLGFGADRTFLEEMVAGGLGEMFDAPTPNELITIYGDLGERIAAEAEAIEETTTTENGADTIPALQTDVAASDLALTGIMLTASLPFDVPTLAQQPLVEDNAATLETIPAIEDNLRNLLEETDAVEANDAGVQEPAVLGLPSTSSNRDNVKGILNKSATVPVADVLDSGVVPLSVEVETEGLIETAALNINGYTLAVYDSPPYTYDLDLNRLEQGFYDLAFSVSYESGSTATGNAEFNVVEVITDGGATLLTTEINGVQTDDLTFEFDPQDGLTLVSASERILATTPTSQLETMSLMTILSRPVTDLLPPGWVETISQPRPVASSIIVIIMTLVLLPQGIFTLVWMLYTWNKPEAAEDYASPTDYETPQYKFTALVPARKEEAVIYQTVMKVAAIDYPEHLKEVLVLVRDEDDDGTIAEVNRAIADLSDEANVRLVTFTDGPYNKPNGLNRGFNQGTGDVYGIFDAEDHPNPEIYNIVNTTMIRKNADVVQSGVQLMTYFGKRGKEAWFAPLNVLEYFFWFKSGLHCFTREFSVTPLGGNTVFGKREWLEKIGMPHHRRGEGHDILEVWDEKCLTEDADLGIRLTNIGASIQIVYSAEHATQEETPANNEQFIKQRTRWMQGFYEIFRKGDWASMPMMKQKIVGLYILLNSLLQASLVLFLPLGIYIALTQEIPVPLAIISWVPIYLLLMQMVTQLVGIREYAEAYNIKMPFGYRLKMMLYYYPYQLMLAISAARAVGRFVAGTNNWEKTAHSGAHRETTPVVARPVATA